MATALPYRRTLAGLTLLATLVTAGLLVAGVPTEARRVPVAVGSALGASANDPVSSLGCELVAEPLTWSGSGSDRIVALSRIQNAGRQAATIHALQLAWVGPYRLASLRIGQTEIPTGAAESPVLVGLDQRSVRLEAGDAPTPIELRFEGRAGEAWQPGPFIVLSREGCELALTEAGASCPLRLGGPDLSRAADGRVGFSIRNTATEPLALHALELDWPATVNGRLQSLALAGPSLPGGLQSELRLNRSPASLGLKRAFGLPIVLPGGAEIALSARFENPAAERDYNLSLLDGEGCQVTAGTWLGPVGCGTEFKRFKQEPRRASMLLANSHGITKTLESIDLIWQPEYQGRLRELLVDGVAVSPAPIDRSPASIKLPRALPIGPAQAVEVVLGFEPAIETPASAIQDGPPLRRGDGAPRLPSAADPPAEGAAGGDLALVARFQGGCQAVLTTLHDVDSLGCRINAGEIQVDASTPEPDVVVALGNMGAEARLARLDLAWSVHNGALIGVFLGDLALLEAPVAPASTARVVVPTAKAVLAQGRSERLRLVFEKAAVSGGYSLGLGFTDLDDAPCADLVVTSPPATPDCDLILAEPLVLADAKTVEMALVNRGSQPLEVESLRLAWPTSNGMSTMRLRSLALIYEGEGEVQLLGQANRSTPVTVQVAGGPAGPVLLPAGARARLQLGFDEIRDLGALVRGLKTSMDFVEGCRVAYPSGGNVIGPERVNLEARIEGLPTGDAGIYGAWRLRDLERGRPWVVSVDPGTEFLPSIVTPHVGDIVRVEAQLLETVNLAERITFLAGRPERTFLGRLTALPPTTAPALPEWVEVDGRRITLVEGFTVVDRPDGLSLGATLMVEGMIGRDDAFVATRIEVVYAAGAAVEVPVAFSGIIQDVAPPDDSPFENIREVLIVGEYEVHLPATLAARLPARAAGQPVEVEGVALGYQVRAENLRLLPLPSTPVQVSGIILDLPAGGVQGTWLIDLDPAGATQVFSFTVGTIAVVDERGAPALPGMRVDATIRSTPDGVRRAIRVRTDWP
ncbi:MAG: hypothetical protein H6648_04550 [Caldilineae bacterium]|nr:hypothetical protein [Chloroflexota bacterium]MCB9176409.1 hypothetical protein [Caldilineae bacterium]